MTVKKLIEKVSFGTWVSLAYYGDCLCTDQANRIPERYYKYKVKAIWLGRMANGEPKLNIEVNNKGAKLSPEDY